MFYAIYMATRPRACACIFHKTLGLILYLLHTCSSGVVCNRYSINTRISHAICVLYHDDPVPTV